MIAELTAKVVEVSAKIEETAKEVKDSLPNKNVDISKRIDISKSKPEIRSTGTDITKRIEPGKNQHLDKDIKTKNLSEVAREYVSDLRCKSVFFDTIKDNPIDVSKLKETTPEEVKKAREEFDDNKSKLRNEWERINEREWPKYDHDIKNDDGVTIRKAGNCYDAHHIQPLSLGGKNEANNITPLDLSKHNEIHSSKGSCTKLVEKVVEG